MLFRAALLLACLVALAAAWTKEDHEIFRLKDEVQLHEGSNVTFYSLMGVKPGASEDEIKKAYRKLGRTLHPDKARSQWLAAYNAPKKTATKSGAKPTVHVQKNKQPSQSEINKFNKEASSRFERLSLVNAILTGSERSRYDHFLYNGFPKWRGTGYYYERFRPGLASVLIGLFIFVGGGVHYAALYLGHRRQREFVERYIKHARRMAWGDDSQLANIPGLNGTSNGGYGNGSANRSQTPDNNDESMQWNRKQKRMMEKEKKKDAKNPGKAAARAAEKARSSGISTPVEAELTSGPVGAKKRTRAENGKILIVDSVGNVFLEEETEEGETHEFLLDVSMKPTAYVCDQAAKTPPSPKRSPSQPSKTHSSSAAPNTSTTPPSAVSCTSRPPTTPSGKPTARPSKTHSKAPSPPSPLPFLRTPRPRPANARLSMRSRDRVLCVCIAGKRKHGVQIEHIPLVSKTRSATLPPVWHALPYNFHPLPF